MFYPGNSAALAFLLCHLWLLLGQAHAQIAPDCTGPPAGTKAYLGGQIHTIKSWRYGRFVVSMKPVRKPGAISSFFGFYCGDLAACGKPEEIDVEFIDRNANNVQFTYHHPLELLPQAVSLTGLITGETSSFDLASRPDDSFHEYEFRWSKDAIVWLVDGLVAKTISQGPVTPIDSLVHKQAILMNIWAHAEVKDEDLPASVDYAWVRYYPWDERTKTFQGKPSFQQEHFSGWDADFAAKWQTSVETSKDNKANFVCQNVTMVEGHLRLTLTKRPLPESPCWTGALTKTYDDRGLGGSAKILGGTLAGQSLNGRLPSIKVKAGSSLSGRIQFELINRGPTAAVFVYGIGASWLGKRTVIFQRVGRQGTNTENYSVAQVAPAKPGTYYLGVAGGWEYNAEQVFSSTNWNYGGSPVWNNGDDILNACPAELEAAARAGVMAQRKLQKRRVWNPIPFAAVKVVVSD